MKKKFWIILFLVTKLTSCTNDMEIVNKYIDIEIEPNFTGENVELLYSDSACLQAKIITPLVKRFNSATERRDEFPEGLHVWFYENTGEIKAEITANWAKHNQITNLWEARNNVVIINAEGQKLETEQFFWNHEKSEVYSEKYTKITDKNGNISSGESFWAEEDFSKYKLLNKSGIGKTVLYVEEDHGQ